MSSATNPNAMNYKGSMGKTNVPLNAQIRESQGYRPQSSASNINAANFKQTLGASTTSSGGSSGGGSSSGGGGDDTDFEMDAINDAYNEAMSYIGNARSRLQGSYGDLMKIATSPYDQAIPQVQQATQEGLGKLGSYVQDTYKQGQNAYDDARRLSSELNQRNLSMFGSGALSSAGQAASELLNRDTFKQFGDIGSNVTNTVSGLNRQMFDLEEKSKAQIQSINMQRDQAKAQAEIDFRNRLAELDAEERKTKQNRSSQKLDALRNLRDYVRQTERWASGAINDVSNNASLNAQQLYNLFNEYNTGVNDTVDAGGTAYNNAYNNMSGTSDRMAYNNAMGLNNTSTPSFSQSGRYRSNNLDDLYYS